MPFELVSKEVWEAYSQIPTESEDRERLILMHNVVGFLPSYRQEISDALDLLPIIVNESAGAQPLNIEIEQALRYEFYAWDAQQETFEIADLANDLDDYKNPSVLLGPYIFRSRTHQNNWDEVLEYPGITPLARYMINIGNQNGSLTITDVDFLDAKFIKIYGFDSAHISVEDNISDPYPAKSRAILLDLLRSISVGSAKVLLDQSFDNASKREYFWRHVLELTKEKAEQIVVQSIGHRALDLIDITNAKRYRT